MKQCSGLVIWRKLTIGHSKERQKLVVRRAVAQREEDKVGGDAGPAEVIVKSGQVNLCVPFSWSF